MANLHRGQFKRYPKPSGFDNLPVDVKSLKIVKPKKKPGDQIQPRRAASRKDKPPPDLKSILAIIYEIYAQKIKYDICSDKENRNRLPISKVMQMHFLNLIQYL